MDNGKVGVLYIIRAEGTNKYKIGVTVRAVSERVKELQTGSPYKLNVVASCSSSDIADLEQKIHALLSEHNTSGEWFEIDDQSVIAKALSELNVLVGQPIAAVEDRSIPSRREVTTEYAVKQILANGGRPVVIDGTMYELVRSYAEDNSNVAILSSVQIHDDSFSVVNYHDCRIYQYELPDLVWGQLSIMRNGDGASLYAGGKQMILDVIQKNFNVCEWDDMVAAISAMINNWEVKNKWNQIASLDAPYVVVEK